MISASFIIVEFIRSFWGGFIRCLRQVALLLPGRFGLLNGFSNNGRGFIHNRCFVYPNFLGPSALGAVRFIRGNKLREIASNCGLADLQRFGDALHGPAVAVELLGESLAIVSGFPGIGSLSLHGGHLRHVG
jgi:hypothetical protein